jgi:uncharacterized protein YndB with AHSA1/START domain
MVIEQNNEIVLERVFDAPCELVWKAWTTPELVAQWWGPTGFTNTVIKMEVCTGGVWEHIMHGPDGTDYPNSVVFEEVLPLKRLVLVHKEFPALDFKSWRAIVTFENMDGKTKVTLRSVFASQEEKEKQMRVAGAVEGGKQTLSRLAEFLQDYK